MRAAVAVSLATLLTGIAHGAESASSSWTSFEFEAYNREYVNVRSSSEWEQGGPITVKVSSPSHRLVVREHSVHLRSRGGGEFDARVRVSFSGEGDLIADVGLSGAGTRMEDHVVAPLQEVEVQARIRFRQIEDGYEIETIDLPDVVNVRIDSRLGNQLVDTCKQTLAIIGIHCGGLDAMFSNVPVPMPKPGGRYFIGEEQLAKAERRRLNRFLERHR